MFSSWGKRLFDLLAEPATRGLAVDDPELTARRRDLAKTKRGLELSYRSWYRELQQVHEQSPPGLRLELGSGGGFLEEHVPGLVRTDLLRLPFVDLICRGEALPFADATVGAIFMINVMHHVHAPRRLFAEIRRVLAPGGKVGLIEPHVTAFSRRVYGNLHPEPFEPEAAEWELPESGPLSGGNDALPWIVFTRDRVRFESEFAGLRVERVRPQSPFVHLFSGGVMIRSLLPAPLFPLLHRLESRHGHRWAAGLALFATIVVTKRA